MGYSNSTLSMNCSQQCKQQIVVGPVVIACPGIVRLFRFRELRSCSKPVLRNEPCQLVVYMRALQASQRIPCAHLCIPLSRPDNTHGVELREGVARLLWGLAHKYLATIPSCDSSRVVVMFSHSSQHVGCRGRARFSVTCCKSKRRLSRFWSIVGVGQVLL